MTYTSEFREKVILSIEKNEMSIRQACSFYCISKTTLQRWLKSPVMKKTRNKPPSKIHDELLLKDIERYPSDCLTKRAQRFDCSKTGIHVALKRLGVHKGTGARAPENL